MLDHSGVSEYLGHLRRRHVLGNRHFDLPVLFYKGKYVVERRQGEVGERGRGHDDKSDVHYRFDDSGDCARRFGETFLTEKVALLGDFPVEVLYRLVVILFGVFGYFFPVFSLAE